MTDLEFPSPTSEEHVLRMILSSAAQIEISGDLQNLGAPLVKYYKTERSFFSSTFVISSPSFSQDGLGSGNTSLINA